MSAVVSPSELAPAHHCFQLPQSHRYNSRGPGGKEPATLGVLEPWGFEAQWDHLILVSSSH